MKILTVDQAAEMAHRNPYTVRRALQANELKGSQRKKGGRWMTTDVAVLDWALGA